MKQAKRYLRDVKMERQKSGRQHRIAFEEIIRTEFTDPRE